MIEGARHLSFVGRIDPSTEAMRPPAEPMLGEPNPRTTAPRPQYDPRQPTRESVAGLRIRAMFADIKAISLAFFDAYLRNDAEGRTALEGVAARGGVELVKK